MLRKRKTASATATTTAGQPEMKKPENRTVVIDDTTLRDGEQSAGVAFSTDERLSIACCLDQLGVQEMEVGIPAMGGEERESIAAISRLGVSARLLAWARMSATDLADCQGLGVHMVDLSVPVSDQQIFHKLKVSRPAVLQSIASIVPMALDAGLEVCVGGEDASRADSEFLLRIIDAAQQAGATRFRFADTLGLMEPFATRELMQRLRSRFDLQLEMHAHDDLGLATANTLAAILGGATHVNTTVHGLGERAGNAPLEEVAMACKKLHSIDTGINLKNFGTLSRLVAESSGREVPWQKSLVGAGAFTHEAGIHVDGLIKDPFNYQGVDPAELGRRHELVLGKHSGRKSVIRAYQQMGITLNQLEASLLLSRIRQQVTQTKQPPSERDLWRWYGSLQAETPPATEPQPERLSVNW